MRLIDADALPYSRVRIYHGEDNTGKPIVGGCNAVVMSVAIKDAPTIDAVPVVRCRDCKEYEQDCGYCDYWEVDRNFDDYCSRGVRKMDGGAADG